MLLIGKGGTLGFAIVVDNGQLVFQIVVDAVVVLVILPLGDILHGLGDLFGNLGFPTDKDMIFPLRLVGHALPFRRRRAGQQIRVLLLSKGCTIGRAVGVDDGVLRFLIVGNTVAVCVDLPLCDVGSVAGYGAGDCGLPACENIALAGRGAACERRRCGTGRKAAVDLILKDLFTVNTVGVSNGVRINAGRCVLINEVKVLGAGVRLAAGYVRGSIYFVSAPVIERLLFLTLCIVAGKFPAGPVRGRCADIGRIEVFQISTVVVTGMTGRVLTGYRDRVDQLRVLIAEWLAAVENDLVDLDRNLMSRAVGGKRNGDQTQYENDGQEQSQNSFLHYFHPFKNSDLRRKARATKRFPAAG